MAKTIDDYIRELNLVYTDSATSYDFFAVGKDMSEVEINYDNSISIGNYISMFNSLYNAFRKEYESLDSLNLGEKTIFLEFYKWTLDKNYRSLSFFVENPNMIDKNGTYFKIIEADGELRTIITSEGNIFGKNYYLKDIEIDKKLCKQYLDLFEKYKLLLDLYSYARNGQIFGDGVRYIYTQIDNTNRELLEGLKTFQIAFGIDYYSNALFARLVFNLGEQLSIDYEKSELLVDDKNMIHDTKLVTRLLDEVYLKQDYLRERKKK